MEKKMEITVLKASFVWLKKGDYKTRCEMSDGSIWEANKECTEWKEVQPSPEKLSELFKEFISNKNPL